MPDKITVVGLGFVGQPVALAFSLKGIPTAGLDVDPDVVRSLRDGRSRLLEADGDRPLEDILKDRLAAGLFVPTDDPAEAYAGADAVVISVGLPVARDQIDHTPLDRAVETLARYLAPGMTVLIRTTAPPGTTAGRVRPRLEAGGMRAGEDFFLAYVPERLSEGRAFEETREVPVLVGAPDAASRRSARRVMEIVLEAPVQEAPSYEAAELAKLVENAQRDVNIAIVQEVARLSEAMGLDTREVLQLAASHPRVRLLEPGPGVGGFCIPNAFRYMAHTGDRLGVDLTTFASARRTNDAVPGLLVDVGVRDVGGRTEGVRVAVLGLAMKDFSVDDRQSPAVEVAEGLIARGFDVAAYDPLVRGRPYQVASLEEALSGARLAYLLVRQPEVDGKDLSWLKAMAPGGLVVDGRGMTAGRQREIEAMGLRLWAL